MTIYAGKSCPMKQALERHSSVINKAPTRIHSDDEAADDEHLKRLRRLAQGHQQRSCYCKAVVDEQRSSSAWRKTMRKRNLKERSFGTQLTTMKSKHEPE